MAVEQGNHSLHVNHQMVAEVDGERFTSGEFSEIDTVEAQSNSGVAALNVGDLKLDGYSQVSIAAIREYFQHLAITDGPSTQPKIIIPVTETIGAETITFGAIGILELNNGNIALIIDGETQLENSTDGFRKLQELSNVGFSKQIEVDDQVIDAYILRLLNNNLIDTLRMLYFKSSHPIKGDKPIEAHFVREEMSKQLTNFYKYLLTYHASALKEGCADVNLQKIMPWEKVENRIQRIFGKMETVLISGNIPEQWLRKAKFAFFKDQTLKLLFSSQQKIEHQLQTDKPQPTLKSPSRLRRRLETQYLLLSEKIDKLRKLKNNFEFKELFQNILDAAFNGDEFVAGNPYSQSQVKFENSLHELQHRALQRPKE